MQAFQAMTIATALTAGRVFAERMQAGVVVDDEDATGGATTAADAGGAVARVIIGGALATVGVLVFEQFRPELARAFSVLVLTTSALVNGVSLAQIVTKVVS